jgi:hypothetical protein
MQRVYCCKYIDDQSCNLIYTLRQILLRWSRDLTPWTEAGPPNVQFTMETKSNSHLLFLDIDVHRTPGSTLGNTAYRKPTHTDLPLNAQSQHNPAMKHSVLSTLVPELGSSAIRKISQWNLNFFVVPSNKSAAVTGVSFTHSFHLGERTHLEKSRHRWPSYSLLGKSSRTSVGC